MTIESLPILKERDIPQYSVRPMNFDEEFSRISWYIRDAKFFQDNKCNIILPTQSPLFQQYYQRSEVLKLKEELELKKIFCNIYSQNTYDTERYSTALNELFEKDEMKESVEVLKKLNENWGFKIPKEYIVLLTKYGGAGSYNARDNSIVYNDNQASNSKKTFTRIVLHEAMHIGVEESIVKKFNLQHPDKERVVDLMCKNIYAKILPDYYMWPGANTNLDKYITNENDILNLPKAIGQYVADNRS